MYQKVVNMAPTWAQVGAMLGSKIVLDTSKSDTENNTEKTARKTAKKKIRRPPFDVRPGPIRPPSPS